MEYQLTPVTAEDNMKYSLEWRLHALTLLGRGSHDLVNGIASVECQLRQQTPVFHSITGKAQ